MRGTEAGHGTGRRTAWTLVTALGVLLGATAGLAGETYRFSSIKEGTYSRRQEGRVYREGPRWRIDFAGQQEATDLTSIIGTERGELLALNAGMNTWFRLATRDRLAIERTLFTYAAAPIEVSRLRVDRVPAVAAIPGEVTVRFSYDIRFKVSGEVVSGRVEGDLRIVTGKSCGIAAPPWAPLDLQVGLPEVDAALRNNFETIEGTPIETVTRVSRQLGSGEKLHATITRRIEECVQEELSPGTFDVPEGYRYEEPRIGIPGKG